MVVISDGDHTIQFQIKVKVQPVNEWATVFGPSETVNVPENRDTGTVIYTVTATDADVISSDLPDVTYFIQSGKYH